MRYVFLCYLLFAFATINAQSGRYPSSRWNKGISVPLSTQWIWQIEDPGKSLNDGCPPDFRNAKPATIPHSVSLPNRAFWYRTTIDLPDSAVALAVRADDGAQVWLNGIQLNMDRQGHFLLPVGKKNSDSSSLDIRVLNNALAGGLKAVASVIPPPVNPELAFSFWGDSQGGWEVFLKITEQLKNFPDCFTLGLGDLTSRGVEQQGWLEFQRIIYPLAADREIFLVPGNHDYDGYYNELYAANYCKLMELNPEQPTWYSFYKGNAAFIVLDPNPNFPLAIDSLQKAWMVREMEEKAWQHADWRFIALHQFPYGQGWKGHHGDTFLQEMVDSLAEKYQIDFVLSGHNHDYERLSKQYGQQQTHFIISGGAGGSLEALPNNPEPVMDKILKVHHFCRMELDSRQVRLFVYDLEGTLIDEKIFTK